MKKFSAIFFLAVYLISLTELNQLVKIPLLVEHFIEHKAKDSELSLLDFLDMHYASNDIRYADYDKDMKLPFKSHDGCPNPLIIAFISNNFTELTTKPICTKNKIYSTYEENFIASSYLSFIWQPPKSC